MRSNLGMGGFMILVMVGVTLWSAYDGGRSFQLMAVAALAAVAGMMFLGHLGAMLPETRITHAAFTALWVMLYTPAWDWLALRFSYPESLYSALLFGLVFGVVRFVITPGGSARPPS